MLHMNTITVEFLRLSDSSLHGYTRASYAPLYGKCHFILLSVRLLSTMQVLDEPNREKPSQKRLKAKPASVPVSAPGNETVEEHEDMDSHNIYPATERYRARRRAVLNARTSKL